MKSLRQLRAAVLPVSELPTTRPVMSQFRGGGRYGDGLPTISPAGDTLWHSLGFEFTVGMGVENSGHFAGFIPKEPFHPTVFPAEERVVLAGEKFDGFLAPGLKNSESLSPLRTTKMSPLSPPSTESVVADVIIQVIVR
jgi:hypothetical protein